MIDVLFFRNKQTKINKKVDKMFFNVYNIIVNQTKQHF
ncbi:hypothetical protein AF63_03910 [Streptococcus uberis Ab71]|nr:hypothetical protein AF63_03910 [Streptococcus uberis Ab71]KKF48515.1 hypothetical protein AF59_06835 [Streptococcus uberis C5072]KKF49595.1 hypothetical protein AF62_03990 [Streptococcus uberis C8329]KKF54483.1 hypothetical protein AF66_06565 [Streptococcus uberis B190]KKF62384.1 hypothetical protein AF58_06760 [Streptococcus uberis C6344]